MIAESSRALSANTLSLDECEFIQPTHVERIYFINTKYVLNRYLVFRLWHRRFPEAYTKRKSKHLNCIRYRAQHQLLCNLLHEGTSHHEAILQQHISNHCKEYTVLKTETATHVNLVIHLMCSSRLILISFAGIIINLSILNSEKWLGADSLSAADKQLNRCSAVQV